MTTKTQTQYAVRRGQIEVDVPHREGILTSVHPASGPENYQTVFGDLIERNLRIPTANESASQIHGAYFAPEELYGQPEFENIRKILRKDWLWIPSQKLWTSEGVYSKHDLEGNGNNERLSIDMLEKLLQDSETLDNGVKLSRDEIVGFAPKSSYSLGEQTSQEAFENSGALIIEYGRDGAKKIAELGFSDNFRSKPWIYGLDIDESQAPEQRVSALNGCNGKRLNVSGDFGDNRNGHAFGVLD